MKKILTVAALLLTITSSSYSIDKKKIIEIWHKVMKESIHQSATQSPPEQQMKPNEIKIKKALLSLRKFISIDITDKTNNKTYSYCIPKAETKRLAEDYWKILKNTKSFALQDIYGIAKSNQPAEDKIYNIIHKLGISENEVGTGITFLIILALDIFISSNDGNKTIKQKKGLVRRMGSKIPFIIFILLASTYGARLSDIQYITTKKVIDSSALIAISALLVSLIINISSEYIIDDEVLIIKTIKRAIKTGILGGSAFSLSYFLTKSFKLNIEDVKDQNSP